MRNFREQAIYDAFEIFLHAAIVYWLFRMGKLTFMLRMKKREGARNGVSNAEFGAFLIWFIAAASLGTLLYFTSGRDNESAIYGLTAFLVVFLSSALGIYIDAKDAAEKIKKFRP